MKPLVYGGDLIRETVGSASKITQDFFAGFPLWLAEYGPHERVPLPWTEAWGWQFSETGNVKTIAGHVDLNYVPSLEASDG